MDTKEYSVETEVGGKTWTFSTGKLALQASGAVVVRAGDTVVMAAVTASKQVREGIDYLPLLVDYEEKLYAAGKIKGSRWVKREGRPSDEAVLVGRVIDRSLRPMFHGRIRNDIQVVTTVLSVDGRNEPDILGLAAASAAVEVSDIPWNGPIGGVRVGKINGEFVINPSFEQKEKESALDLVVAGTEDHIIMIEAGAREIPEEEILAATSYAQGEIKKIIAGIRGLKNKISKPKREMQIFSPSAAVENKIKSYEGKLAEALFKQNKEEREQAVEELRQAVITNDPVVAPFMGPDKSGDYKKKVESEVNYIFDEVIKKIIQEKLLKERKRVDGRGPEDIRPIYCEVGLLPRVHGSALFMRGETQVLTTATLGGPGDVQLLEDLETEAERVKRYIHHYNMPGFSTGEVAPMRSPGRREIGHGALAERSLAPMIPPKETFPYTIRLVSEVLSSNGSTSMAAACGSTLSLMDAGVPIKAAVAGIAMGLVMDEDRGDKGDRGGKGYEILSDIQGIEDGAGHMDFKVAGTKQGITALQLDIKVKGLTIEILQAALKQARAGRLFILEKMFAAIPSPRKEMSPYAPRIVSFRINTDKIRDVIGPGGKTINEIIADTGVEIDIEDTGLVTVTSTSEEASKKAVEWIKNLTREVKTGEIFQGKVTRILDFGAFVEILPGQEGLVHISEIAPHRVEKVSDVLKVGDVVPVIVKNIDELGRINLSRKALLGGEQKEERPGPKRRFIAKS